MNIFFKEHRLMLESLLKNEVCFILIGGYAVNFHGYNRTTGDMDIWLEPSENNKQALINALKQMGFEKEGLETISSWDFTQPQKFSIGDRKQPDRTEFMTHISGVRFSEAKREEIVSEIDGLVLPIIHYNTLVKNKKSTGRTKDMADVEQLEKIMLLKKKGPE